MTMRLLLLLLFPTILFCQPTIEVNTRLTITNNFGISHQSIIAFDSIGTDGADNCCDAPFLQGQSNLYLVTKIGNISYSITVWDRLVDDKSVELYTFANPDTGLFVIEIEDTLGYERTITSISDSVFPDQRFSFPYTCQGPITGNRFTFHTSAPVKLNVINGCESDSGGRVIINNPNDRWSEELRLYSELFQNVDDTIITNLQSGSYQYKWYNQTGEQTIDFEVNNNPFDFDLLLPNNYVWIDDPGIIPQLFITGNYDQIMWNFGDGSEPRYDDLNPVYYYSEVGQYTLTVTVTSGNCTKTIQEVITVDDIFGFPNIKSKKNDYPFYYGLDGRLHKK